MPLDGTASDVESDFEILETIGGHHDDLSQGRIEAGAPLKTLRRWLLGHRGVPEDFDTQTCLVAMAVDLELFTPSLSGKTMVDRHLASWRPRTAQEREAFDALAGARFRLVRIVGRDGPDLVRLTDLATRENLVLLDSRISPLAAGAATAMRLCPLRSGRHVLISPLFAIDEAALAAAMAFVAPGRPLGHRCAAALYRDVARRGFMPMATLFGEAGVEELLDALERAPALSEAERLALRWLAAGDEAEADDDLLGDIRRAASIDNLVDACGCSGQSGAGAPEGLDLAFRRIAEIQMATIVRRAQAGLGGHADALDRAAAAIARHIAQGDMSPRARELFDRVRAGASVSARDRAGSPAGEELGRVIQRILALRARTVDRGCTENEAMAAAAKVAELLDRHDLTLDEVSVRQSPCEGAAVDTGRRRRAPVDSCNLAVAHFCDCRVWSEQAQDGALRYIFFGLKADVEAARLLHDLIEDAFETETAAFRSTDIYLAHRGGDRRATVNSFQIGMANGVRGRLGRLKAARQANGKTTGFDLVAVKHSVVDEEVEGLGLELTVRTARSRRLVHGAAYAAGKVAGALFEPEAALGR